MRTLNLTYLVIAVASLGLAGCDRGPGPSGDTKIPDGELPTRSREAPVTKALDVVHVAWPDRASIDVAARDALPEAERAKIDRSAVPVLVPRRPTLVGNAVLVVKPAFYAAALRGAGEHEGVTVNVQATRVTHRYPGIEPTRLPSTVRGDKPALVTQNEAIWSVSWKENGISYVLEVECSRPGEDARCADATFATQLVEDLVFVGGSFERGGAQ